MATIGTYFLNEVSLSSSTSVYINSILSILAPDGFYKEGSIVRQQVSGKLLPARECSTYGLTISANIPNTVIGNGGETNITLLSNIVGTTFSWTATAINATGQNSGVGSVINNTLESPGSGSVIYTVKGISPEGCKNTILIRVDITPQAVDNNTEINIWFDNSGSMNTTLQPLNQMKSLLYNCLSQAYNNDITLYNSRVKIRNYVDNSSMVKSLTLTGDLGTANVNVAGYSYLMTFDTDLNTTATNFVNTHYDAILLNSNTRVAKESTFISFYHNVSNFPSLDISNLTENLTGTFSQTTVDNSNYEKYLRTLSRVSDDPNVTKVINLSFGDESNIYEAERTFSGNVTPAAAEDISLIRALTSQTDNNLFGVIFQVSTLGSGSSPMYPGFRDFVDRVHNGLPPFENTSGLLDRPSIGYELGVSPGNSAQYYLNLIVSKLNLLGFNLNNC